jgi:hypothetical protein
LEDLSIGLTHCERSGQNSRISGVILITQAKIANLKGKKQQEIEAAVKSVKKAMKQAKAETSKAKDMLAKNIADQAT